MSLRFIYGRAGSGKSRYCLNEIKTRIGQNASNPLVLLVPEQYSFQAEKNLIKALGTGGIIKTEVLSFRRMAHRVFNEVGGITYPHVNSASKCMIIYKILERKADSFNVFSKVSNLQGFVNTISEMITEFKKYNITPGDLEKAYQSVKDNDLLKGKLLELNLIYSDFENMIHEKYRDADDDLTMLSYKLDKTKQFDGAEVWIDSFSGFTPQEYLVIGKLMQKCSRLNISICTDCLSDETNIENTDVFSPVKSAINKLFMLAKEGNIEIEAPAILNNEPLYRFRGSSELAHLERNFFSFPYARYAERTKDISVFSSVNIYSEIESTARDIIRLCREESMRYKDIAVVTANLEAYEKLLSVIFKEYDIPVFIDKKRNITNHPLVQLILSCFDIFIGNWSYEAVFRYLKTGLTNISREDIDLIENYVLACGIKGNRWTQQEMWSYKPDLSFETNGETESESRILIKINNIRQEIVRPLAEFRNNTKGRRTGREICSSLYELLCSLGVPVRIEELIEEFRKAGQLNLANEYGQIWNIVMEVFDQIVEVMGEETSGIERFSNLIAIAFNEYKAGLIPPSLDQVLVGSVSRSTSHEVKALYVLGVNDGVFPSKGAEEGILSDRDRENLRSMGLEIANDTRTNAFHEQYLIYTTLTAASSYLRVSYPIADQEGRTMRPSIVIARLRKLFSAITEASNIICSDSDEDSIQLVTQKVPTFNELVTVMRKYSEGEEVKPVWMDVFCWYLNQEEWGKRCALAKAALGYTSLAEPINADKVKKLYGSPAYSSVSRFERFAACPFAYYTQYGLLAKERKVYRLSAPDVGTFMHAVIERFSGCVAEEGLSWRELERDWCEKIIAEIVDELLEKSHGSILNSSSRYKSLTRRLKRVLTRSVWLIAEHIRRSSFEPIGYEMEFGDKGEFPPIRIELPSGEIIQLTGRIDRVDAYETQEGTYLRIVDYKSGTKAFRLSDIYYGMQLQLITYLNAIWENSGADIKKPILPGGMLYFRIDDPIVKGNSRISEEDIEKAIMKQLKMRGLLLADVRLIREMDNQIEGNSLIIPARINKGDVLGKSSAASIEQFQTLRKYVVRLIQGIAEEMFKGDVSIKPYKNKRTTPCSYCSYSAICQFDPMLRDNKYRVINDKDDEEIWKRMSEAIEDITSADGLPDTQRVCPPALKGGEIDG